MANIITLPAQLVSAIDLKDRSCKLTFETRELENSEFNVLRDIRGSEGHLLYSLNPIQETDIPKESASVDKKSPSKRLRSVLYVLWQQEQSELDFEIFYNAKMESLIEYIKKKLQ